MTLYFSCSRDGNGCNKATKEVDDGSYVLHAMRGALTWPFLLGKLLLLMFSCFKPQNTFP